MTRLPALDAQKKASNLNLVVQGRLPGGGQPDVSNLWCLTFLEMWLQALLQGRVAESWVGT